MQWTNRKLSLLSWYWSQCFESSPNQTKALALPENDHFHVCVCKAFTYTIVLCNRAFVQSLTYCPHVNVFVYILPHRTDRGHIFVFFLTFYFYSTENSNQLNVIYRSNVFIRSNKNSYRSIYFQRIPIFLLTRSDYFYWICRSNTSRIFSLKTFHPKKSIWY